MEMKLTVQTISEGLGGASVMQITDYAHITQKVEIMTQRLDSPGKMTFVCLEEGKIAIPEGSAVECSVDGIKMFKGFVMAIERTKDGETTYTAYDQLRYLKANASYAFKDMSLSQIIQQIALDFGLVTGKLADTGYVFPCLIKGNEGCLDIIFDALTQTIIQTGKIFLFYDDAGTLTLAEAKELFHYTVLGDNSLATNYTYNRNIDADTYNRIKLVKKNEETGRTDTYTHEDTDNIKKWGLLQYYDEVDKNLNDAQVDEMCSLYLKYYNRVLQTLTIEAVGVPSIRAGSIVPVQIAGIDGLVSSRLLLAEKVTHHFDGDNHTMSIEVKSFDHLGGEMIV